MYTAPELKLVRQLSIEVHSAASKDPEVRRVLALSNQVAIQHIRNTIALAQSQNQLDPKLDQELTAHLFCTFVMGLLHMDTLLPGLIGNLAWRDFVYERIAASIGIR